MAVVDLHFGLPIHVLPQFLLARFQEFAPAPSVFGLLYVIPPLVLYTTGKAVANMSEDREGPVDGILNGIPVVFGYLPMMIVVVLLMPGGSGPNSPDIVTALLMSGIVYPLAFGILGGIADAHYPADSRRVGVGYGAAMVLVMTVLLLLSTFVIVSVPSGVNVPFGDRLLPVLIPISHYPVVGIGPIAVILDLHPLPVLVPVSPFADLPSGIESSALLQLSVLVPAFVQTVLAVHDEEALILFLPVLVIMDDPTVEIPHEVIG
jgi:hypothetical protein